MVLQDGARTRFLREETINNRNKAARRAMDEEWTTADLPCGLCERKALATNMIFDNMPLWIGPQELIVGTRTLLKGRKGNEDGHDVSDYGLGAHPGYVKQEDIGLFGFNDELMNGSHRTPDYAVILKKGVGGIIADARERLKDENLREYNRDFLRSVIQIYQGFGRLIKRYAEYADELARAEADEERRRELFEISRVCGNISEKPASDFREAVQLFWFAQLGATVESIASVNYGRVDVILGEYLKEYPREAAQQLVDCFLLKMYDQADVKDFCTNAYSGHLNITLGGVDKAGNDAVNEVTMMFLDGLDRTRLPDPEAAIRVNSRNPEAFLRKAAGLSASGLNCIAFYNDDLFIDSMIRAGVEPEYARSYGFDLCQDINIPGIGHWYTLLGIELAAIVRGALKHARDDMTWEEFLADVKDRIARDWKDNIEWYAKCREGVRRFSEGDVEGYAASRREKGFESGPNGVVYHLYPMAPLPFLSGLYHGCIEKAEDLNLEPYPDRNKGMVIYSPVEGVNSLAALKKCCFDTKSYTLSQVWAACENDFASPEQERMRKVLWSAPKWGNDEDYADLIAKDVLEYALRELEKYRLPGGGRVLGGIHQPLPVSLGRLLPATPEGRKAGTPLAVSLSAENGTMKNGITALLKSAAKIDYRLCQWNFCVMSSCASTAFKEERGADIMQQLIRSYFGLGGLQYQPNVLSPEELKDAKAHPENHRNLIVRLWGVSAHFVQLPEEMQDELIARM